MTWRHRSGVVTIGGERAQEIVDFLDAKGALGLVEIDDAGYESMRLRLALDESGAVAGIAADATIAGEQELADFAQELADHLGAEVSFGDEAWIPSGTDRVSADPFEQPLGIDIASFAERAAVFTRADRRTLEEIAAQVEDVIHAVPHLDGHVLCITEGPVLATLQWDQDARPAVIFEEGGDAPAITLIPASQVNDDPLTHVWSSTRFSTPSSASPALTHADAAASVRAFIDTVLGTGAIVRELMTATPAVEPNIVRQALAQGIPELLHALDLPPAVGDYLAGRAAAEELPEAEEIYPASFARSVRRAVSEASSSVSERAEAVRARAVAARTRAETAFDAAEAFAEDVVIPVRQNWVSPALAVAETALGVLSLRKARRSTGLAAGAYGTGAAVLLADAVVNTLISVAPILRRKS